MPWHAAVCRAHGCTRACSPEPVFRAALSAVKANPEVGYCRLPQPFWWACRVCVLTGSVSGAGAPVPCVVRRANCLAPAFVRASCEPTCCAQAPSGSTLRLASSLGYDHECKCCFKLLAASGRCVPGVKRAVALMCHAGYLCRVWRAWRAHGSSDPSARFTSTC